MPSPFPGMDPYIEGQSWSNFHFLLIAAVVERLLPGLQLRYVVRVEERVYLEHEIDGRDHVRPDVTILDDGGVPAGGRGSSGVALASPVAITLPIPEEVHEH